MTPGITKREPNKFSISLVFGDAALNNIESFRDLTVQKDSFIFDFIIDSIKKVCC